MVGKTISHYKVLEKIGEGGMGEVFLAHDTSLDRKVALKFLPEELQQDSTAKKRFLREAKSAAALDHPFICHIHEVGEAEEKSFIAMEYVQGETLKDKLAKGPLPLNDALEKATEVTEALEEAHKQGIVHRDLKPSNIMLTPQGHVKVMDFGLAKRVTPVEGEEQEITTALTKDSSILGTVPYMSPEQLRGKSVDARSDIFSFGVVLYEMLSGVHPFKRGGQMETANAIFSEPAPPLSRYTEDIPVLLQHTVKKMLAKEPDRRYQLIHDVRTDLEDARDESEGVSEAPAQFWTRSSEETVRAPVAGPWASSRMVWILTGVLFVAALALGGAYLLREPTPLDLIRFTVEVPATETFSWAGDPVVSPDGRRVVLLTQDASGEVLLFLRSLDSVSGEPVAGTEGASSPFWSPDGRFIAYFAQGKLKKIDLEGGPPETLSDAGPGLGGTWNAAGDIVFSPMNRGPLYHVTADGGMATPITELNSSRGENSHRNPQFLPDGVHFLYLARSGQPENRAVYVGSLGSPEVKRLLTVASNAMYSPDGYLLFVREGTLMAQTFDPQDLSLRGTAFPVAEGVDYSAPSAHGVFSVSADGRVLAYRSGGSAKRQLCWLDRSGQRLSSIGPPGEYIQQPQLSPDGKRVALSQPDLQTGNRDIWLMDLSRGIPLRFTFGASNEWRPIWSPDGSNILYQNDPNGVSDLYQKVTTGTGEAELLFSSSIR